MKKISIIALAAIATISSCTKDGLFPDKDGREEIVTGTAPQVFNAIMEGFPATRAALDGMTPSWEVGDVISIDGHSYTAKTAGTSSTFEGTGAGEATHHAYFPAGLYNGGSPALPAVQTYVAGKFDMPMYAESDNATLSFKNLCAVLAIKVTSDDITTLKAIKVASDKKMNGTFTVSDNKAVVGTDGTNVLVLESSTALTLNADGTTFYIAIPAQNYNYLNIYLSSDGETYTRAMATKKAAGLGDIARSKMFNIGYETNAFQIYANGPYFADRNVGASSATDVGSRMTFADATDTGSDYVWGANWCTPSKPKMDELLKAATSKGSEKVKCEIVREGNVETGKIIGFKFTGKETGYTGNSVFFPAKTVDSSYSSDAEYWSSTSYQGGEAWDMYLHYYSGEWLSKWYSDYRGEKFPVRPVLVN